MFNDVDSYDTPAEHRVSRLFRFLGRSRWYFYAVNFAVFCRSGRLGKAGRLDKQAQIEQSNCNFKLVEDCGGKIHVRGLQNLRALNGRPCVLIANHMSLLECAILHAVCRQYVDFSFVIKASLLKVPFFRYILLALQAIPVSRTNPREDLKTVLIEGRRVLESGRSIIIFPQATRSEEIHEESFSTIGIKLAKSAQVPVLPFALKTDLIGVGKHFRDLGPIRPERGVWFEFAPALEVVGNGREQHQEIISFIQNRLAEWKRLDGR